MEEEEEKERQWPASETLLFSIVYFFSYYKLSLPLFNMISDINECEGKAHNCSSNAVCNNTKRSYNCTCKPGYEGDGNHCTGNFFLNFVILYAFESIADFIFP